MRRRRHCHTCVRPRGSRPHKGPWITPELSSRQGRSADPSCAQIEHPFANLLVASARLESGHEAVVVKVRLYSAGRRAGSVPAVLRFAHFRVGLLWLVPSLLACSISTCLFLLPLHHYFSPEPRSPARKCSSCPFPATSLAGPATQRQRLQACSGGSRMS